MTTAVEKNHPETTILYSLSWFFGGLGPYGWVLLGVSQVMQPDAGRASSHPKDRLGRTSRCLTRLAAVDVDLWLGARQAADQHICLWPTHKLLSLAAGLWKERSKSKCSTKQEAEAAGAVKCLGLAQRHFCRILLVRAVTGTPDSRGQRKNTWRRRDCCGTFGKHSPYGKGIVKDGRAGKGGALCRDGLPDQPPWSTGLRGVTISGEECYRRGWQVQRP